MVLYKTAGDEQLVLTAHLIRERQKERERERGGECVACTAPERLLGNLWFSEQLKDCDLINNYCAMGGGALDALATPLTHDHDSEI